MEVFRLNARVKHRAWKTTGTVVDFPFDYNRFTDVMVLWDGETEPKHAWPPAIMVIEDEEEIDWDELT